MDLMTRRELKGRALDQLKGNWTQAVLVCFVFCLLTGLGSGMWYTLWPVSHFVKFNLISFLYVGTIAYGTYRYFLCLKRGEPRSFGMLFSGFGPLYWKTVLLCLLMSIFTFLWTLLLIVPGIIALMRYSQAWFIMADGSNRKKQTDDGRAQMEIFCFEPELYMVVFALLRHPRYRPFVACTLHTSYCR